MSDNHFDLLEMDSPSSLRSPAPPIDEPAIELDLVDSRRPTCLQCKLARPVNERSICQACSNMVPHVVASTVAESTTLVADLAAIAQQGLSNASVQGIGSLRGGQLRMVGFSTAEGYITAIRNGVPARTHAEYIVQLRTRFGLNTAALESLRLPGPMAVTALPVGEGIAHTPTGPSIFDKPKAERAFVVGPKDTTEIAPSVKLEHGSMVAGAVAEGHGVLVGWSGKGKLTRGALVEAIASAEAKAPLAASARAQAGRVMSTLTGLGFVVRVARENKAVGTTMWTVGKVNHKSLVGSELGSVEMRVTLNANGELATEGNVALGERVRTEYQLALDSEIYQAADITGWLGRTLMLTYSAVRFGVGWYVPACHADAAGKLCAAVAAVWGTDWIVPALPVATSDQLRDGIVRGLTGEVDGLMARLTTERATAKAARDNAMHVAQLATDQAAMDAAIKLAGDIGPKRAGTFLAELRGIGARIVAYGQVLGEERIACAREQVRQAVIELETVLGDDYSGISARFSAVWDEIELDRKRHGGAL
jgi:hypothetical protein